MRPRIANRIAESNTFAATFCGGEPLTVPGEELVGYARIFQESGKQAILNTNGLLVASRLVPALKPGETPPFNTIGISIDGATEEMEKEMRGPKASLNLAVEAAQWVKEKEDEGVDLKIATVVSSVNEQGLPDLARLVSSLKPKKWRLYQYSPRDNAGGRHTIERAVFDRAVERARTEVGEEVEVYPADNVTGSGCFIVRMDGKVVWPDPNGWKYEEFPDNDSLETPIDVIWQHYPGAATVVENKKWQGTALL